MIERGWRVVVVAVSVLAWAATAAAGPLQDDLVARRARLMEKLGPNALAIVWSAEPKVYSLDVDYEFRQDSHLLYLTGITQEGAILVLMPGNKTSREFLFVREPNPRREHWNGHLLTQGGSHRRERHQDRLLLGRVRELRHFRCSTAVPTGCKRGEVTDDFDAFFEAVAASRPRWPCRSVRARRRRSR